MSHPFRDAPPEQTPVYVEHSNPYTGARMRRYASVEDAVQAIHRASRVPMHVVSSRFSMQKKSFWWGFDSWRVVTAMEMLERSNHAQRMYARMAAGEDVEDIQR